MAKKKEIFLQIEEILEASVAIFFLFKSKVRMNGNGKINTGANYIQTFLNNLLIRII